MEALAAGMGPIRHGSDEGLRHIVCVDVVECFAALVGQRNLPARRQVSDPRRAEQLDGAIAIGLEASRGDLGTFDSREAAAKHEREIQYFKRH